MNHNYFSSYEHFSLKRLYDENKYEYWNELLCEFWDTVEKLAKCAYS